MKTIGYILFFHVGASLIALGIATIPFTSDTIRRQRVNDALRYTAETTAFIEASDPQTKRQFEESKEYTSMVVWDYIGAIENKNSTDGYVLLSFLCSNLGIAAYLVFRRNDKRKAA
jgi:hypothetical protein